MEGLLAHCLIITNIFQMKERNERKESKKVKGKKKAKHYCTIIIVWKKKNRSKGKVARRGERTFKFATLNNKLHLIHPHQSHHVINFSYTKKKN